MANKNCSMYSLRIHHEVFEAYLLGSNIVLIFVLPLVDL